jgi:RHS repeat-associated protein
VGGSTNLTYSYDPLDRLSSRSSGATDIVNYLYEGDQLLGEYSSTGALIRRYVRGPGIDEPIVIYDGANAATMTWLYPDERGSITATADASGNPVSLMSYGPFGEPNATTGVSLRYTGQMLDPDSGLYYYKARWYSPYLGRFLSPDPALFVDGLQTYTYVGNDPVDFTDPQGLFKQLAKRAKDLLPKHCNGTASQHPILSKVALGADVVQGVATIATPFIPEFAVPVARGAKIVSGGIDAYEGAEALANLAQGNNADIINYGFGHAEGTFLNKALKKFWPVPAEQLRTRKGRYAPGDQTEAAEPLGSAGGEILSEVCP